MSKSDKELKSESKQALMERNDSRALAFIHGSSAKSSEEKSVQQDRLWLSPKAALSHCVSSRSVSALSSLAFLLFLLTASPAGFADEPARRKFTKMQVSNEYFSEGAGYGDFNQDKIIDVVCGPHWYAGPDYKQKYRVYDGKSFSNDKGYSDNFFSFGHDINADGWTDVVTLGFPGRPAHWFENPKGKGGNWPKHVALPGVDNESPAFADLTGDGRPEIICSYQGRLGYGEFDPDDPTARWNFHAISDRGPWAPFTHGLGLGDVNGDGRMDLLTALGWLEQPASLEGDPIWEPHVFRFCPGGTQMFAYDVDGDGDNDVITSLQAHAYGLSWFEHVKGDNGEITFEPHPIMGSKPEENPFGIVFSQLHAMSLYDMDGDGLKDIITGKCYWAHNGHDPGARDSAVLYFFKLERNKDGAHFIPQQIDDNSGVGRQVSIDDLNGDGRPDIVVANKKGVFAFLNRMTSH